MLADLNPRVVGLSLVVAALASYTLLDMGGRIRRRKLTGTHRVVWMAGGSIALGTGLWVAHFVGMLACPMRVNYGPVALGTSYLLAVATAAITLHLAVESRPNGLRLVAGASLLGGGLTAMHAAGMAAILVHPALHYATGPIVLSAGMAVLLCGMALRMNGQAQVAGAGSSAAMVYRLGAPLALTLAVGAAHYIGMAAVRVRPRTIFVTGQGVDTTVLVTLVTVWSACALTATLVFAIMDSRSLQEHLVTHLSREISAQSDSTVAGTDRVTGISNRVHILERMEARVAAAGPRREIFGVMFLDLDGFKTVNDSLGYAAGDDLLRAFSNELLKRVRPETLVGRMGGDEFMVLLDGTQDEDDVAGIARSIFARLQKSFQVDDMPLRITASAGIAVFPRHGTDSATLLKSANIAMHNAKRRGKNSCSFFEPAMSDAAMRALQINRSLGEALEKQQFSLVFQPKFEGREHMLSGAEALIRWNHPVMGNIAPMDFIPVAEQTGQIVQIAEWVIAETCRQIKAWEHMGLSLLPVAINLSPEQLRQENYAERVSQIVAAAGVSPQLILFEITETAAMREPKLAAEVIRDFQRAGFEFAIDDFGIGYSSMAYLQQFRVKELKIDRFFIDSLESNGEEGHAIVSAIIALAHALHMTVVAEGVETAIQLRELDGMGCDQMQGYLLGRPLTPFDFETLLRARHGDGWPRTAAAYTGAPAPNRPILRPALV